MFGIPDEEARTNHYAIEIPKLASFVLTHDWDGELQGIDAFPEAHPPVGPVFWSFRIMVGVGLLMLLVSWLAIWQLRKGRTPGPWLARSLVAMTFSGWIAVLSGWYVTEIGRQPYLVSGVLRTSEAVGSASAGTVLSTLIAWLVLYAFLLTAYIAVVFYLARTAGEKEGLARGINAHGPRVGPMINPEAAR